MIYYTKYKNSGLGLCFFLLLLLTACAKKEIIGVDPYAGGRETLGVKFTSAYASPENGVPGDEVLVNVTGLKAWEDKFDIFINDEKAEIVSLTDSTIKIKVPEKVSSGSISVLLQGEVLFGPRFEVQGKVSFDSEFKVVNGSNGVINDAIAFQSGYLLVGGFTNFENQATLTNPIGHLAYLTTAGDYQSSLNSKKGANGTLLSVSKLSSGKYITGGAFNLFNNRTGINGITRLNGDGSLDTSIVSVINLTPERDQAGYDTVAAFNGGVLGTIKKTFVSNVDNLGERIYAIGDFQVYGSYFYERSTRDFKIFDQVRMNQVVRMEVDGTLDETYNYDPVAKASYAGGNGAINDAYLQADNKLILVGDFTTFNGEAKNRIVRLNDQGKVDGTFNTGSGADGSITSIQKDLVSGKLLLVGSFASFNGKSYRNIVRLNEDGSVDESFKPKEFIGGIPNFAAQLKNGKVVVSGTFSNYDGVTRRGLLILNNDGSVSQEYNHNGEFSGRISKVIETQSSLGNPAIILIGFIQRFNDKKVGNVLRVEIKN